MPESSYRVSSRSVRSWSIPALFLCSLLITGCIGGGGGGSSSGSSDSGTSSSSDGGTTASSDDSGTSSSDDSGGTSSSDDSGTSSSDGTSSGSGTAVSGNSIEFSWEPPHERQNDQRLYTHEIEGHELVYRRHDESDYSGSVFEEENFYGTTVEGLSSGTYHFAVRTKDSDGRWSPYSEELAVDVN
ncbi:fibronectin type III domain-containing protein [Methylonatrum kenyense]|uniref:fibronectin type III domain-containing protein n=1 Tax=Methylonatrum kenyense TaxID=455253 RepID=UPI0020BFD7DD|nr:fibronectin type III domain-containing protein [Methylonatrum kenyense]MCK8516770.1 fibronectin type III domain-containing protein [Methylonatrum kenyense]